MKRQVAENYFRGKEKYNCAQAILKAYQDEYNVEDEVVKKFKKLGNGKAENGLCGAIYAGIYLLVEDSSEEKSERLKISFQKHAESLKCKEIRKKKTLTCKECVGITADILNLINKE